MPKEWKTQKNQNINVNQVSQGHQQYCHNRLWSPMPDGGEGYLSIKVQ